MYGYDTPDIHKPTVTSHYVLTSSITSIESVSRYKNGHEH